VRFDDPTPAEVRETMRDVFQRPEFQRTKSIVERILDWISKHLSGSGEVGTGSSWGGSIANILLWVVLILLAVGLVIVVVHVVRNRTGRRSKPTKPSVVVDIEEYRTASEWASEAEQLEAAGRWKEAIRCRYRELVARLVDAGVAAPLPGRTTGELRGDVSTRAPQVEGAFSAATGLFEGPWYADTPTGPAESDRFRSLAADVLEQVG
jgi:hypothetical protein